MTPELKSALCQVIRQDMELFDLLFEYCEISYITEEGKATHYPNDYKSKPNETARWKIVQFLQKKL